MTQFNTEREYRDHIWGMEASTGIKLRFYNAVKTISYEYYILPVIHLISSFRRDV